MIKNVALINDLIFNLVYLSSLHSSQVNIVQVGLGHWGEIPVYQDRLMLTDNFQTLLYSDLFANVSSFIWVYQNPLFLNWRKWQPWILKKMATLNNIFPISYKIVYISTYTKFNSKLIGEINHIHPVFNTHGRRHFQALWCHQR